MPSINGLTNPFENSILNSNLTQLEKEKQIANYNTAIDQGYEPPQAVLDEIASILAADVLSPEAEARLQELLDYIIAAIGPVITSDGGGESASLSLDENTSVVTTVTADDRYSLNGTDSLTYSIIGGADASLFSIDATTGLLTFNAPPDYEAPIGGDNIFDVLVQVNDGAVLVDTQALQITIADVNDSAPVITSAASVTIDENTTAVTTVTSTDLDTVGTVTYSITGGNDAVHFLIDANTGVLTIAAQDFEAPADAGSDNIYEVEVTASDGVQSDVQLLSVTVQNVNEAPTIVAALTSTAAEDDAAYSIDLLAGASDVDAGDTATLSVQNLTGLVAGITLNGNSLHVDPAHASFQHLAFGQSEIITVSFDVEDAQGASVAQSATITIEGANDAPVAADGSETLDEDTVLPGSVSATDIDGDALIFTVDTQAGNGTVAMQADGTYTYTPDPDYNGADSFVFQVSDGMGGFDTGSVDLTINPVADGFTLNTAATPIAISYVRGLTYDPGHAGTTFQNVGGVAFDSVTGKVYESAGIHRYNENYVRVYDDAANFEAGTYSQTLSLGNQIDINYPSDIVGTYFAAHDGQLIGRSSLYGSDYSPYSAHAWDVGFWNASTGAMKTELTVNPGADFSGLNWGGYNAMNVMNDGDDVYALSRYANSSTWQLAELDTTTNSVIATENINLGSVGYAFVVEDFLFIGSTYSSGVVSRAYDIENNVMHNVNLQFGVPGNIYWSNTSYDSVTDSLYLVSSPNTSGLGELYEVENISDYLFA